MRSTTAPAPADLAPERSPAAWTLRPGGPFPAPWADVVLLVGFGLWLFGATWQVLPDLVIDFGRELYVPWQLAEGQVLYRDVAWFNGPLSPWLNAAVFRLFGASLWALMLFNLALVAGTTALLYRLLGKYGGRLAALLGSLTFLGLFAFGGLLSHGCYSWICPYSHGATHGLIAATLMLYLLARATRRPRASTLFGAGICLGLTFLTKPEVFAAAAVAALVWFVLGAFTRGAPQRRTRLGPLVLLSGAAVPVALAFVLLFRDLAPASALEGVLGAWPAVMTGTMSDLHFYRLNMGLVDPAENLRIMFRMAGLVGIVLLPAGILATFLPHAPRRVWTVVALLLLLAALILVGMDWQKVLIGAGGNSRARVVVLSFFTAWFVALPFRVRGRPGPSVPGDYVPDLVFLVTGFALVRKWHHVSWYDLARALPVLLAIAAVVSLVAFLRHRHDDAKRPRALVDVTLVAFSLAMLAKMLFKPAFHHYGFTLAMPATVLLVAVGAGRLPALIQRRGGQGRIFLAGFLGAVLAILGGLIGLTQDVQAWKYNVVGQGPDSFRTDGRDLVARELLVGLEELVESDETLAVLPEGVMLNYLARRASSVPYVNFMPPEFTIFGEAEILEAFESDPPDFIALLDRPTPEYGFPGFGEGFGEGLSRWVAAHYRPVLRILPPDASDPDPWCGWAMLLERRDRAER